MNEIRKVGLLLDGSSQVIKVPAGFELPGTEVTITKDGERLIIEPAELTADEKQRRLRALLDSWEDLDIEWPDVDEGLLPPDDIKL